MPKKIKVLVVDDSAIMRALLSEIISSENDMIVVDTAEDPFDAREKIKKYSPDVITLDIEMPKMDGLSFLKNLMRLHPMPVIMISSLTQQGAQVTLDALAFGAVDYVPKPVVDVPERLEEIRYEITDKIRAAAIANIKALERKHESEVKKTIDDATSNDFLTQKKKNNTTYSCRANELIVIGASTGGTEAILEVLKDLPENSPPIAIVQHIPPNFSSSYAKRLDRFCAVKVKEAENGDILKPGCAVLAPGDFHLKLVRKKETQELMCVLTQDEKVGRHRPAVDVLFDSVTKLLGLNVTAALLTGMGKDGATGLLNLKNSGAFTLIQDEESCVVWGMPQAAFNLEAHCEILPLNKIASRLITLTNRMK